MSLITVNSLVYCLFAMWSVSMAEECVPRKIVPYRGDMKQFREEGVRNYSSMLLQEPLGLLFLGARGAIYAMDVNDISAPKAKVDWQVTAQERKECESKGKLPEECQNYILILHSVGDGRMYVCGTKAFAPSCDYMTYSDGKLRLSGKVEEGKGKCPFDPAQHASSIMVDGVMYAATYTNFLASEYAMLRTSVTTLRTENTISWLNDPTFVYMDMVPESIDSIDGDDDKIYFFFSEKAMEFDFYNEVIVSRVARVCKGDLGGHLSLQKKWTSYLKARMDCSVLEPSLPYVVRDVFLLRDADWRNSIFYAVFTPQSGQKDLSAICAYNLTSIRKVFSQGMYKKPINVESSRLTWVKHTGDIPRPRPGACIDNAARGMGVTESLDLPDKTLQFVQNQPLMHDVVQPLLEKPLIVKRGPLFTCIVVDKVAALNGQTYPVMFIGTENGCIQKALNYDGEMFITEERQLFSDPVRIKVLRLSSSKGQLYAASDLGVVQVPLSDCTRYTSCQDCVLARDPYCAWDQQTSQCRDHLKLQSKGNLIQILEEADVTRCPKEANVRTNTIDIYFNLGNVVKLACQPDSNLAEVLWHFEGQPLLLSHPKYYSFSWGVLILDMTAADGGHYSCQALERAKGHQNYITVAEYQLHLNTNRLVVSLSVFIVLLCLLALLLLGLHLYQWDLPVRWPCRNPQPHDPAKGQREFPLQCPPWCNQLKISGLAFTRSLRSNIVSGNCGRKAFHDTL